MADESTFDDVVNFGKTNRIWGTDGDTVGRIELKNSSGTTMGVIGSGSGNNFVFNVASTKTTIKSNAIFQTSKSIIVNGIELKRSGSSLVAVYNGVTRTIVSF